MIVPMKKAAIIVRSIDAETAVKDLRMLGLLHVEHQKQPQGADIAVLQEELSLINAALEVFARNEDIKNPDIHQERVKTGWHILAKHLVDLEKRHEQLQLYAQKLKATIAEWEEWGDFEPQQINELLQAGIYVSLYRLPVKQMDIFPGHAVVKTIFTSAGIAHCVAVSQSKFEIPFKEVALPKQSLSRMQQRISEDTQVMHSFKDEISGLFRFQQDLIKIKKDLEKEMELSQAIKGMAQEGELAYIAGYAPVDEVEVLTQTAHSRQWGILVQEPAEEDNVPTLIRNPRWISFINPLFKLLEITPGYRELDISAVFLIFFSIFFGIIIGDAGYGLVYFLLTFLIHKKFGKRMTNTTVLRLSYILCFCAVFWGVLTGTFFGQAWLQKIGFRALVPALNDAKSMQTLCFFLGALHLTVAHTWRAILKTPSLAALADAGWICVLWAAFFLARSLILGDAFPPFGKWLIILGVTLVVFFINPQKNILRAVGSGLGTLALNLMNNFTDVVSYVRLFAVGLAGVAIADTFNAMAAGVGRDNFVMLILGTLIVLGGHGLNLILGPMSVLVHGVRLNVLEFSGHASVTWNGILYKPLRE